MSTADRASLEAELAQARADAAEYRRAMHEISTQRDVAVGKAEALESDRDTWKQCADERQQALLQQAADKANMAKERDEARSELARLKPTGQVAEDAADVVRWINGPGASPCKPEKCPCLGHRALARLAAKAQAYERLRSIIAYIQECDGGAHLLTEAGALSADRQDEVREEHNAAVADNAALVKKLRKADALFEWLTDNDSLSDDGRTKAHAVRQELSKSANNVHPGAALLEQHRKEVKQARNEGLEEIARVCIAKRDRLLAAGAMHGTRRGGLEEAASIARALKKEPEQ